LVKKTASAKPHVIVVAKRSSMTRLEDGEVDQRARLLLKAQDATVRKWRPAHEDHVRTLERRDGAARLGAEVLVLHGSHALFETRGSWLVVSVGGDGTLLAASHCVSDVPILGVNSAPRYSVGFFAARRAEGLERSIGEAVEGKLASVR
jgi:NAD+ kinase